MDRRIKIALVCACIGVAILISVLLLGEISHNISPTQSAEETEVTLGETIPSEDYEDVQVLYDVDLKQDGGVMVPEAVYNYRLNNPVKSGTITVTDYYYDDDDNFVVVMNVNGEIVEYTEEPKGMND